MKKLKKLLSIVLAVAMVLSLVVVTSADSTATYTITIKPANGVDYGETYYAYKIFDVTYSGSEGSETYAYTISSNNVFFSTIKNLSNLDENEYDTDYFTLTETAASVAAGGTVKTYTVEPTEYTGVTDSKENKTLASAVVGALNEFAKTGLSTDGYSSSNTGGYNGTATYTEGTTAEIYLDSPGWYYVTTTVGSVVEITTAAPKATIDDKNTAPTVQKEVYEGEKTEGTVIEKETTGWDDDNDAQVGDTVYFQTTIKNINNVSNLTLYDVMDPGLSDFNLVSVVLYSDESDTEGTALSGATDYKTKDYVLTTGDVYYMYQAGELTAWKDGVTYYTESGGEKSAVDKESVTTPDSSTVYYTKATFKIAFDLSSQTLSDTSYIVVTYSAIVNENAVIYNEGSNDNETYVSYGDASRTTSDKTKTYVYEVALYKYTLGSVTEEDSTITGSTALAGASFVIKNSNGEYAKFDGGEEVYTFNSWVESGYTTLTTGETGYLYLEGLDAETEYTIHETAAPSGYNALASDITFVIAGSDSTDGRVQGNVYADTSSETVMTYTIKANEEDSGTTAIAIENNSGSELPSTGGIGTTIFYVVGGILVVGAVVLLITRKRMGKDEK